MTDATLNNRADPSRSVQTASAVMMVRPAAFGWNAETAVSNRYQRSDAVRSRAEISQRARDEFDGLVVALRKANVAVHALDDRMEPALPDAVFPNNWVSFHHDGTVVLYPMLAPIRRLERRMELLAELEVRGGFRVTRLVDLTHHELNGAYLEGTGSMVLDRVQRVAYACLSPRTHLEPLEQFCDELGYSPCTFTATDASGQPVYHTNVLLSIGSGCAIVALDMVAAGDRLRLVERLSAGGRHVETISAAQVAEFAGNALELRASDGARVLAMSARAAASLDADVHARLSRAVDRFVTAHVPTIESIGGGSVRCMLAEVFLPRGSAMNPS